MGTVIGYGTNYIAVKMLFRPKNEVKFLGKTIPFTPGAIPKGKPRLAKAVGNVVGNTLITKEDIKSRLISENAQTAVLGRVHEVLGAEIKTEIMAVGKLDGFFVAVGIHAYDSLHVLALILVEFLCSLQSFRPSLVGGHDHGVETVLTIQVCMKCSVKIIVRQEGY